jgi:hypothetical protein
MPDRFEESDLPIESQLADFFQWLFSAKGNMDALEG